MSRMQRIQSVLRLSAVRALAFIAVASCITTAAVAQPVDWSIDQPFVPGPVMPDPAPLQPPPHPYLRFSDAEDWSIIAQVQLLACTVGAAAIQGVGQPLPQTDVWQVDGGRLWFPYAGDVVGSLPLVTSESPFGAEFYVGGFRQRIEPKLVALGPSGATYMEIEFGGFRGADARARFEVLRRSWRYVYNEQKAVNVQWPTEPAPEEIQFALDAGYGIPVDRDADPSVNPARAAVEAWTNGIDPKTRLTPAALAKFLAARVLEHVRPAARGAVSRVGIFQGFCANGPNVGVPGAPPLPPDAGWRALASGQGTDIEMVTALAAVLRHADIPTRLVIGVRSTADDDGRVIDNVERNPITAWVEFHLRDERTGEAGWIPVDIVRQRDLWSSRAQPLNRPWQFFGNNDQGDLYAPVAHHFFPITNSVYYGPPALYGWVTSPATPGCGSHEVILEIERPTRAGAQSMPIIQVGR